MFRLLQLIRTKQSKHPSGHNPNFVERLLVPCKLPVNPLFCPSLNIVVKDSRLGGFATPTVANTAIPLHDKLPWCVVLLSVHPLFATHTPVLQVANIQASPGPP